MNELENANKPVSLELDDLEQVTGGRFMPRSLRSGGKDDRDPLTVRVSCKNCHDVFEVDQATAQKGQVKCRTCHQMISIRA